MACPPRAPAAAEPTAPRRRAAAVCEQKYMRFVVLPRFAASNADRPVDIQCARTCASNSAILENIWPASRQPLGAPAEEEETSRASLRPGDSIHSSSSLLAGSSSSACGAPWCAAICGAVQPKPGTPSCGSTMPARASRSASRRAAFRATRKPASPAGCLPPARLPWCFLCTGTASSSGTAISANMSATLRASASSASLSTALTTMPSASAACRTSSTLSSSCWRRFLAASSSEDSSPLPSSKLAKASAP
mmetsp:Transcript_1217/g.3861  ORF Transcript_1217/g.3861 Transcript_1217/m.3861 type:complete len:250 (-) Transcript_1217:197-946(-)